MPKFFPIIAFVGPAHAGKTTLIRELFKRHPNYISPLKSFTNRERLKPEDDIFYHYVSEEEILDKHGRGEIVQYIEHNGKTFGSDKKHLEETVKSRLGAQAYDVQGVLNLIDAGYNVIPIKIVSSTDPIESHPDHPDIIWAMTLVNDFSEGGMEKSIKQLEDFLHTALAKSISERIAEETEQEKTPQS